MVMWYEFKSTSTSMAVMTRGHFCGVHPGPRTIFTVDACRAYSIEKFSIFQGMDSEYEVLFRPLSQFRVVHATKNIIDPAERGSLERSGFPDAVGLMQIDEAAPPPPLPAGAPAAPPPMPSYEEQMAWALQQSTLDATPAPAPPPQPAGGATPAPARPRAEMPTEAEMASLFAKVGGSLEQVRSATRVDWSGKRLTAGDCKVIAHLIATKFMPVLTTLYLGANSIGYDGAQAIAEALKVNPVLTELNLELNGIGPEGAMAIAEALKVNPVLTELNLRSNSIGGDGAKAIAEALKVNPVLTKLDLWNNNLVFSYAGKKAVREAVKDRSDFELGL